MPNLQKISLTFGALVAPVHHWTAPTCGVCGDFLRFENAARTGYVVMVEVCSCGRRGLGASPPPPVVIPEAMKGDPLRSKNAAQTRTQQQRKCAVCKAKFMAQANGPRKTCSMQCWRKQKLGWAAQNLSYQRKRRSTFARRGLTARGTVPRIDRPKRTAA